jgi:hypothetical protein
MLRGTRFGRGRTPIGYRMRITLPRAVDTTKDPKAESHYHVDGKMPYQLYYPRVHGYWPKHRWRLLWAWFFDYLEDRRRKRPSLENPIEWEGVILPATVRSNHRTHIYSRWAVPVEENLTRVIYFFTSRPKTVFGRIYDKISYEAVLKWMYFFNFSDQDYDAMRSTRYQYPEYLSSTDNPVIALRKLITEHARGIRRDVDVPAETMAEQRVYEADEALGARPDSDLLTRVAR